MEQFMMSLLKWGTITKLGVCPGPSLKPSLNIRCNWVNRCPHEIGDGKGQHSCMGNFRLPSLLAYSNKSPRLIFFLVQLIILASAFVADSTLW